MTIYCISGSRDIGKMPARNGAPPEAHGRYVRERRDVFFILTSYLLIKHYDRVVIGDASGVDRLAKQFCEKHDIPHEVYVPNWDQDGKKAGPIRNRKMVEDADAIIAIWDGTSRGTRSTIDAAIKQQKELHVHYLPEGPF